MAKKLNWDSTKKNPRGYESAGERPIKLHDSSYVRSMSGPVRRLIAPSRAEQQLMRGMTIDEQVQFMVHCGRVG